MNKLVKIMAFMPLLLCACDDLFEPAIENNRDLESMYEEPSYAQGVMTNAYLLLPYNSAPTSDVATDDAVSNDNGNAWRSICTGAWTSQMIRPRNGKTVIMPFNI